MQRALRRTLRGRSARLSTAVDYYDSQSGARIAFCQGVQTHGVVLVGKGEGKGKGLLIPSGLASLQLGNSPKEFATLLPAAPRSCPLFAKLSSSGSSSDDSAGAALAALAPVAQGVVLDLVGRNAFAQLKPQIQRARQLKLAVRCNLHSCLDWAWDASNAHGHVLALSTLVGELADLDVGFIILHDPATDQSEGEAEGEEKEELLRQICDEVFGVDCVGVPVKQRFGFHSSTDARLDAWVQDELDSRNRLRLL